VSLWRWKSWREEEELAGGGREEWADEGRWGMMRVMKRDEA
jgi:hypothetical protein